MFLKSLQLQGFKSFPDKVKLDFEKGITATVGPNGSGKSNISDAVRWVLGEQKPSALRIKSMEDIIFDGTNNRKAAGFAEVIMTIDNSDRWLNFDADEVAIARRYYRSGSGEFKINGKTVLLREVNELLMDTGIGSDGYSMIGQGKISDIVEVRASDRRAIFEEAAGISKYRHRKQETEKNLAKTEDNLTHLDVIVSELEARVGPLERESEKAKKAIELGEQYKKEEIGLWLFTLSKSMNLLRDQDYKITLLQNQYDELVDKVNTLDSEVDGLYQENNRLSAEKDERIRAAASMEEQAAKLEGEAAVLEAQIRHNGEDVARLEKEIDESQVSRSALEESLAQKGILLEQKNGEISKKLEDIEKLKGELEGLRSSELGQSAKLLELREKQNSLTVKDSELRLRIARAQSQIEEIENRSDGIDSVIADRKARAERLAGELDEANKALGAVREKAAELSNAVNGHKLRLDSQRKKADEARRTAEELRINAQDKKRRASTIEDLEKSLEGYDYSVRRVIKHAETGGLRGVVGPVSRVIDVDAKFTVAVETALGASIKNIIVETENDGKRAMEHLKQTNGGRATFLPISVIRPRSMDETGLDDCAGYIAVASGLVRCEQRYRDIIDNLLGKVCVVEDMDSAIAIARRYRNRFRIVTLDGQVINAGGSMTGGSSDKNAGLLSRKSELEKLRAEAARLEEKAAQAAKEAEAQTGRASAEEAALLAAQSELSCCGEDRVAFEGDIKRLSEQLEQNDSELKAAQDEQNGAAGRIAALSAERDEANGLALKVASELTGLEELIAEQTGGIDVLAAERERLSGLLSDARMSNISLEKEAEAIQDTINELKTRIEQGGGKTAMLRGEMERLAKSTEELTVKTGEILDEAKGLRAEAVEKNGGATQLEQQRDILELQVRQKREEAREVSEQREGVSNEKNRLEERKAQTQKEYDGILLKMLDSYNLTRKEAEAQYEPAENERAASRRVSELKGKIRALGDVNMGAIEEYKEVSERYTVFKTQIDDVIRSKSELEKMIAELTATMQEIFSRAFEEISRNFTEIFPQLFGGGSAKLVLMDDGDCLNCGIDIEITPPGKERRSMTGMSGGEKSLIAVAIYFAIMKVRPSPFCFLDEIDHALDENNVINIARYIKRFVENTQYIVITHRRGMMEEADVLYGVTKQDGISRLIELRLDEVEEKLGKLEGKQ